MAGRAVKKGILRLELVLFGRAYCASPYEGSMDDYDDFGVATMPVPWKRLAARTAKRKSAETDTLWHLTKWRRSR